MDSTKAGRNPIDVVYNKAEKNFVVVNARHFLMLTSSIVQLVALKTSGLDPPDDLLRILSCIRISCTPRSIETIETDYLGKHLLCASYEVL